MIGIYSIKSSKLNFTGVIIIFLIVAQSCSQRKTEILKIAEPVDSTKLINVKTLIDHPNMGIYSKVLVQALIIDIDKENHSWIKLRANNGKFVLAKPFDDFTKFPQDILGKLVILQGRLKVYAEFKNNPHQKNKHRILGKTWVINDYQILKNSENAFGYIFKVDGMNY
ncbi:MAG: hypothetical protein Q8M15_13475 [Bacteroidota bacterium]|nr:hypothetical protein [Bacteroidota bacterium]